MMNPKILILAIYPAPYRVELFEQIQNVVDADVFFEHSSGDERASEWFSTGKFNLLDSDRGRTQYRNAIANIRKYSLVAIYDYTTKEGMRLVLKCQSKRILYVVNSDGMLISPHGNFLRDIAKGVLLSKASAYLTSGQNGKQYFKKYGAPEDKIFLHTFSTLHPTDILAEPINQNEKLTIRNKLKFKEDCKIALAVGRFIPLKRYEELIRAWRKMPDNYMLLIIGGGPEEGTYRKVIDELKLNNVYLEQFHPKAELFEYYKAADVFVHPTSYDVWGLVINEAMACGLPVVISDHCVAGLELVKNGENGYIVSMGNDAEMCERVRELCESDRYDSMSRNALDTIRPYTIEHMAETHIDVFKKLLIENKEVL